MSHRIAGGDEDGAVRLLQERSRWFLDHGAMARLLRLGEQLASRCAADPRLRLVLAWAAGLAGRFDTLWPG